MTITNVLSAAVLALTSVLFQTNVAMPEAARDEGNTTVRTLNTLDTQTASLVTHPIPPCYCTTT